MIAGAAGGLIRDAALVAGTTVGDGEAGTVAARELGAGSGDVEGKLRTVGDADPRCVCVDAWQAATASARTSAQSVLVFCQRVVIARA
ncbi:MAG TPA: hypothetical protein VFG00_02545 [Acidothermaceae bacterium]|nr:hypothetical protein [Acidothermaceae bacterium]